MLITAEAARDLSKTKSYELNLISESKKIMVALTKLIYQVSLEGENGVEISLGDEEFNLDFIINSLEGLGFFVEVASLSQCEDDLTLRIEW